MSTATRRTDPFTPAELEGIADYRAVSMARGLATGPTDRPAAEAGVRAAYRTAGFVEPKLIIWMDSPLGGAFAAAVLTDALKNEGGQLGGQLRGQLRGQLGGQLRDQLWGQLQGQLWDQLGSAMWGQQELPWLAFYAHARRLGVTYDAASNGRLDALLATADLSWWWPYEGFVVLTDRPTELHHDQDGRLHSGAGPAIAYADGWSVWAWHGLRVPEWVVTDPTVERIGAERNSEIRRCAIESMGWPEFVHAAGLELVDEADDPGNPGQRIGLYDVPEQVWGDRVRVLLCVNGTVERGGIRRRFGLTVPADTKTALAAAGWGYGLTGEQYATAARRT